MYWELWLSQVTATAALQCMLVKNKGGRHWYLLLEVCVCVLKPSEIEWIHLDARFHVVLGYLMDDIER